MSYVECDRPDCVEGLEDTAVETVVVPRARDLGGFEVRRALPAKERQMIGPFIFFDQMGPAEFVLDSGIDVRPHPHIGLSTVTYLFRGEIHHRDSLGTQLVIRPGEVNWMTAGQGIAHSERTTEEDRRRRHELYGIQAWVALPKASEEIAPAFVHHDSGDLPTLDAEGKRVRLIAGSLWGERSPVATSSEMFYADVALEPGARLPLPAEHEERGIYLVEGAIRVGGQRFEAGRLISFRPGLDLDVEALEAARMLFLGGEPMDGPRYIWWNFVSSSLDRIEQAKEDWRAGRFEPVAGETDEFIPLPETPMPTPRD